MIFYDVESYLMREISLKTVYYKYIIFLTLNGFICYI